MDERRGAIIRDIIGLPERLPTPLALVCHDAGAANIAFAWIGREVRVPVRAYIEGPARAIWERSFPEQALAGSLDDALSDAAALLSGTGWASDLEHRARLLALERGIVSLAVVDHWVNYRARFEREGRVVMPDAVIVTDHWAEAEARMRFGSTPIGLWPNRYFEREVEAIAPIPADGDILYIGEPARDDWGRGQPGEFQALDFFMSALSVIEGAQGRRLRIRPHPSEDAGKYAAVIEKYNAIMGGLDYAQIDDVPSLAASISKANITVGMGSAAMVVALASGRRVYGSLPPWAPPCSLPHDGILHLRTLVGA